MEVIIVGGGWAGCAAAFAAIKGGAKVTLIEKTNMLLGTGLVGGIMRNNGRFTAFEEIWALGGGDFLRLIEGTARHRFLNFPGHNHATLYDTTQIEPVIRTYLQEIGVNIHLETRITGVNRQGNSLYSIQATGGQEFKGDMFVDTTGSAGPVCNCTMYGGGCAMCILRCPAYGPRVSLTAKAGVKEIMAGEGFPQFEAMSGSCILEKTSLTSNLVNQLETNGMLIIPLPKTILKENLLGTKACQQYNLSEYAANLIILDTGHAKIMTPYFPLESLRTLPGFARARYADPYSGGKGNSVRFMAMAPCGVDLKVDGVDNLYCAGEKTGLLVGHTEAISTGMLAGINAVRHLAGKKAVILPDQLAVGDIIAYMHKEMLTPEGLEQKYTFSGSVYFQRMKQKNLYTTNVEDIQKRVKRSGLKGVFCSKQIKTSLPLKRN